MTPDRFVTDSSLLKQRFRWTYGVLQACWKHKGRLFHRGAGVLGWVILPTFAIYQFLVPLVAPVVARKSQSACR